MRTRKVRREQEREKYTEKASGNEVEKERERAR